MTSHSSHPAGHCANCSHPAPENFCPACGQKTHIETPTLFEFIHEYLHHYVALEGTLTRTLWTLLSRPGSLTAEYIDGRRQRYIKPLQLYLSISFIFFVLLGLFGSMVHLSTGKEAGATTALERAENQNLVRPEPEEDGAEPGKQAERGGKPGAAGVQLGSKLPKQTVTSDNAVINAWGGRLDQRIADFNAHPGETWAQLLKDAMHKLPYAVFGLMPIFAFLLWLVYYRRRMVYGVHLVFALHVHAFAFLMFLLLLLPFVPAWLVLCVFPVYFVMALKKVYGGRWSPQVWRAILLFNLYAVFAGLAISALLISLV